ncbi:MAG: hypothetical protein AB7F64_07865 [Gammaproteobacteria bacterium]
MCNLKTIDSNKAQKIVQINLVLLIGKMPRGIFDRAVLRVIKSYFKICLAKIIVQSNESDRKSTFGGIPLDKNLSFNQIFIDHYSSMLE